jgi:hypothetical protein
MSAAFRTVGPGSALDMDPDLLAIRDRACLRLLLRCGAATSPIASQLVYRDLRRAQERLLRLYRAGFLERTTLPRRTPGHADLAYRLSPLGHQRMGTRRAPSPASYLRHTIDTASAVCALNRTSDREHPPVQLWLTDSMSANVLGQFVRPDSIVVITTEVGSAVLALEIDEGTEHRRTIRAKLAAYRRPIAIRPNWHLLVVVPGPIRAAWMVRVARSLEIGPRSWVVTHGDLARDALDCMLQPLDQSLPPSSLRALLQPPRRLLPAPVGSWAWLELLAAGGGEVEDGVLAP